MMKNYTEMVADMCDYIIEQNVEAVTTPFEFYDSDDNRCEMVATVFTQREFEDMFESNIGLYLVTSKDKQH